jgi:hypothetical protein
VKSASKSSESAIVMKPIGIEELPVGVEAQPQTNVDSQFGKWSKWHWHHLWWLVLLLFVGAFGVMVSGEFDSAKREWMPELMPLPSTYNLKPSGYSAFFELCQKVGLKTERFEESYRMLKEKNLHGTLVMIEPFEAPSTQDAERIAKWVEKGNNIVYFDYFDAFGPSRRLANKLGAEVGGPSAEMKDEVINQAGPVQNEQSSTADQSKTDKESKPASQWRFVDRVITHSDSWLRGGKTLVEGSNGALLMLFPRGQGSSLLGTDIYFCRNDQIRNPRYKGNFQFLINHLMSCKQPVIFDEKCHGYSSSDNAMFFLMRRYPGFTFAQLLVIALVAWLSCNQRFGRARRLSQARHISNLEFIDGLAATFRRARARDAAWDMVFHPFKTRLCKRLGVAPDDSLDVLARAWSETTGGSAAEYEAFLVRAQEATKDRRLSEKEFLELLEISDKLSAHAKRLVAARRVMGA